MRSSSPPNNLRLLSSLGLVLGTLCLTLGCSDSASDGGVTEKGELTEVACHEHQECDDGVFCNGVETCDDGFCRLGLTVKCDDGIDCTNDHCDHAENRCTFTPPDEDGDGHADASCTDPAGQPMGDDCDDSDASRFPGNSEVCDPAAPDHDEDCDAKTYGYLDSDLDGVTSAACCNIDEDDNETCGQDCDDDDYSVYPEHPEICDDIDNDCDGKVDVNTKKVSWYPDADGDHFGNGEEESIRSCSPIEGHSLRPTDCDDTAGSVHGAAVEECDGVDNDCDGDIDEDGVCLCGTDGDARTCACSDALGVQYCTGGLWQACDCRECQGGQKECVGGLLPRHCVEGRWLYQEACGAGRPLCDAGECLCADGTDSCEDIVDVVAPRIVDSYPTEDGDPIATDSPLTLVFSEAVRASSLTGSLLVSDVFGAEVSGRIAVDGALVNFIPEKQLSSGQDYALHIAGTIEDLSGNSISSSQSVLFSTKSRFTPTPICPEASKTCTTPQLSVNTAGEALAVATSNNLMDQQTSSEGEFTFNWKGGQWQRGVQLYDKGGALPQLSSDGRALAVWRYGSEVSIYDRVDNNWSADPTLLGSDNQSQGNGVVENESGRALIVYSTATQLMSLVRNKDGQYSTPLAVTASSARDVTSVAISKSGFAGIAFVEDKKLTVCQSDQNLTQWTCTAPRGTSVVGTSDPGLAIHEDGSLSVAWSDRTPELANYRIHVQDLDASGEWVGQPALVSGLVSDEYENYAQLALDGEGYLYCSFRYSGFGVVRRDLHGSWGSLTPMSPSGASQLKEGLLFASDSGRAVFIFRFLSRNVQSIWASETMDGTWSTPEKVEDSPTRAAGLAAKMAGDSSVLVLYQTDVLGTENEDLFSIVY